MATALERDARLILREDVQGETIDTDEKLSSGSKEEPSLLGLPVTESIGMEKRVLIAGIIHQKYA